MINLLILTNELNYTDGVTGHLFYLLRGLKETNEFNISLIYSGGDSEQRFKKTGINVLKNKLLSHNNRSVKNFSKILLDVFNFSKKNKIDIIHSHNHYAANTGYRVSKFLGVKTIQTIHGLIPEGGRLSHFKADKFISVNEKIVEHILENKIAAKENVKLIRHGLPPIENLKSKNIDEIKILCASRLVYEKGVDIFIKAAAIVSDKYPGKIKFIVAGEGDYKNELLSLSKELKTDVTFLGKVKDMIILMQDTNIFVMPSRLKSEGFPMSIAEAALTKNLVISSQFDSLDYVLNDGTDGLTFEIDNHAELADKIIFALENPNAVNKMTGCFYNKAIELFNLEHSVELHSELYNDCLGQ